ncbi:hypothetical protein D3C78_1321300 [compost metagenome]
MAENGEMSSVGKALLDFSGKWMLPFVLAFAGWMTNETNKLEERINVLQRESVTQTMLQVRDDRLLAQFNTRMGDIVSKQDEANRYLIMLIQKTDQKK